VIQHPCPKDLLRANAVKTRLWREGSTPGVGPDGPVLNRDLKSSCYSGHRIFQPRFAKGDDALEWPTHAGSFLSETKLSRTKKLLLRASELRVPKGEQLSALACMLWPLLLGRIRFTWMAPQVTNSQDLRLHRYAVNNSHPTVLYKRLAVKLKMMAAVDQKMRKKAMKTSFLHNSVDSRNTNALVAIVHRFGWPTPALVGKRGSQSAWLLAQHADLNPKAQRYFLQELRKAQRRTPHPLMENHRRLLQARLRYNTKFPIIPGSR